MYYTFRMGEVEQCFDGTPEEIIQVMKAMNDMEKKEQTININTFPLGPIMPGTVSEFLSKTALKNMK